MEITVGVDDPRRDDITALLAVHLAFCHDETALENAYALDPAALLAEGVTVFAARRAGQLLGVGGLKSITPNHAEIKSMHTAAAARGEGVAAIVLDHLLAEARRRGCTRVSLETGTTPNFGPARRLYERAGFSACGPFGSYRPTDENQFMTRSLE